MHGARVYHHVATLFAPSDLFGQQGCAMAHTKYMPTGLVVAVLRSAPQALYDFQAGLDYLGGAFAHQLLQDPLPVERKPKGKVSIQQIPDPGQKFITCLLYTSDAAD